jgi:hypothetical protein
MKSAIALQIPLNGISNFKDFNEIDMTNCVVMPTHRGQEEVFMRSDTVDRIAKLIGYRFKDHLLPMKLLNHASFYETVLSMSRVSRRWCTGFSS